MAGTRSTARAERASAPARKQGRDTSVDRRQLIIQAAAKRFAENGFAVTTVRQIADDVKILSGSLYHHFATKEEILDEIVGGPVSILRDRCVRIAALPIDAESRLVTLISDYLASVERDQASFAIFFHEWKFFRRNDYFQYLMGARMQTYEAMSRILTDGAASGLFRPEVDITLSVSATMRMLNTTADWYQPGVGMTADALRHYSHMELSEFFAGFVLRSLRVPERIGAPLPEASHDF